MREEVVEKDKLVIGSVRGMLDIHNVGGVRVRDETNRMIKLNSIYYHCQL